MSSKKLKGKREDAIEITRIFEEPNDEDKRILEDLFDFLVKLVIKHRERELQIL